MGFRLYILLLLAVTPSLAFANEVDRAVFAATPFSTPHGFEWVMLLFVLLFVTATAFLLRKQWKVASLYAVKLAIIIGLGVTWLGVFVIPLKYIWFVRNLRWGEPAFFGWDWAHSRTNFIWMNALTLAFIILGSCCLVYFYPRVKSAGIPKVLRISLIAVLIYSLVVPFPEIFLFHSSSFITYGLLLLLLLTAGVTAVRVLGKQCLVIIGVNILIYLCCLLPYVATGAYSYGLAPWKPCDRQVSEGFSVGLIAYTRGHNGHLPLGKNITQVWAEFQPYYETTMMSSVEFSNKALFCEAGVWYNRHPRPYIWNAGMAGKSIDALRRLPRPVKLISCPYHRTFYIDTADLVKAYDNNEYYILPMLSH